MQNTLTSYIDNLLDEFQPFPGNLLSKYVSSTPALNVKEFKDRYEINLTIPGLDSDKVKIELRDNILTFRYSHEDTEDSEKTEDSDLIREEYRFYSFTRSVGLPKNIDSNTVKATHKNGILKVEINKSPEKEPKYIEIEKQEK